MINRVEDTVKTIDLIVETLWTRYRIRILRITIWFMIAITLLWLGYEFWRLLWQSGEMGAVDLKLRFGEVRDWFEGRPIYEQVGHAVYPPASYMMLWPFLGWLSVSAARWFWTLTSIIALGALVQLIVRESGANTRLERAFMVLMPLSIYATGATIGNGQLGLHVLPCLMVAILGLRQRQRTWRQDVWLALLMVFALIKPTVSVPFFWIILFVPTGLRPAALITLMYAGLTLLASLFQAAGPVPLFLDWVTAGTRAAVWGATHGEGSIDVHVNLHSVSSALNIVGWNPYVSILVLVLLGLWIYFHRHWDVWVLLGVTAIVARFWTYHGWYDDVLMLLPMIALFRIAKKGGSFPRINRLAGVLCALMLLFSLAPGGLYSLPAPWNSVYVAGQTLTWLGTLWFLVRTDGKQMRSSPQSISNPFPP